MRNRVLVLMVFLLALTLLPVNASSLKNIEYKNLKDGAKITIVADTWSNEVAKKDKNYYVKRVSGSRTGFSEFFDSEGNFLFSTATHYEFIHNGRLIGYSNFDLKFYEYFFVNNLLERRELSPDEVKSLFPNYKLICLSDFSADTNSLKIKKDKKRLKIILYNDSDSVFYDYEYFTDNSKLERYFLKGFLNICKQGLIHFSHKGEYTKEMLWFVLLVR